MIQDVNGEIRMAENEVSPMRKQKKFIFQLAEDFIYSKERNIQEYKKRKTQMQKKAQTSVEEE